MILCVALMANAQSVDTQIQKIRNFYNRVQEQVKIGYSTENPIGTAVIDHVATYSAVGYIKGLGSSTANTSTTPTRGNPFSVSSTT